MNTQNQKFILVMSIAATLMGCGAGRTPSKSAVAAQQPKPYPCTHLRELLSADHSSSQGINDWEKDALDHGPGCIPDLEASLQAPDRFTVFRSAAALTLAGGQDAVRVLRKKYDASNDPRILSWLISAMATTGRQEDVQFMMKTLEAKPSLPDSLPMSVAAHQLALLHIDSAKPRLKVISQGAPGNIAVSAAGDALRMIDDEKCLSRTLTQPNTDELVKLVLNCHRPHWTLRFYEGEKNRYWRSAETGWQTEPASGPRLSSRQSAPGHEPDPHYPYIHIETYLNNNQDKAIAKIGFQHGPTAGSGYSYLLEQHDGNWRIVWIRFDWVS